MKDELIDLVSFLEKQVPYAAALYKKSSGTRVNVNRVQEAVEPVDPSEGLVFTLWNGQKFFEYSTNHWNWTDLKAYLGDFSRFVIAQQDRSKPLIDIDPGPRINKDFENTVNLSPQSQSLKEKLERAKARVYEALAIDPQVMNVFSIQGDITSQDIFVNRHKVMSQRITRVEAMVLLFVSDGNKTVEIYDGTSKNGGLDQADIAHSAIRELVQDGKRLLSADRLTPGLYDVVTDPEWSGIIAHECFGHGMETDLYVRERALSQHYIGKPVASSLVNMFDDPSLLSEAGGYYFDDEGQLSERTHVIEDGILRRGLTDMASAHKLGFHRSSNGRRESYARKAYARMSNTFFGAGTSTKEDLISSVEDGFYLRYATNGMEDPQAWGIQVEGLWAEEIKQGKLTGNVFSPVIMTGFVPDLLKSVSMVANDVYVSGLGMCGKGHKEWVKNTTGGPHLRMKARLG